MSLVLDASLALAWLFDDERKPAVVAVLADIEAYGARVPGLWRLEVANSLQMALRRRRIDAAFRDQALQRLAVLPIVIDTDTNHHAWKTTLRLADRFGLTLYDAAYLELAQRHTLPLASLDRELRAAAHALGLPLQGLAA